MKRLNNGLFFSVTGYSDKAELYFMDLVRSLKNLPLDEIHFKQFKESLLRDYQNAALELPLKQALEYTHLILYQDFVTSKKKAIAIKKITFSRFEEFTRSLFEETYVEGMLYGNLTEKQAMTTSQQLLDLLSSNPYLKVQHNEPKITVLPIDQGPFFYEAKTKAQGNAVSLVIQIEPFSLKNQAIQEVLMQSMEQSFFTTLRTKQQTGYIVYNSSAELEHHLVDFFGVQSNTHDGRDLLARFELFLEGYVQELPHQGVTIEQFNNIKKSLISKLKQGPKSILEMGAMLQTLAFDQDGDFELVGKQIRVFEELTYDEFLEAAEAVMGKQNKRRVAVLVLGEVPQECTLLYKKIANCEQFKMNANKDEIGK